VKVVKLTTIKRFLDNALMINSTFNEAKSVADVPQIDILGWERISNNFMQIDILGWERISNNFIGPLTTSHRQNKYLLTVVGEYSRFPFAFACKDISACP